MQQSSHRLGCSIALPLFVACGCITVGTRVASSAETIEVPCFGVFERSFRHADEYENPYTQLDATATLTKPDGSEVTASLFWDGGDVWKLRFSPEVVGRWAWSTRSKDQGLDGESGTFACIASVNKGGLRPMAGYPAHFQHQNGSPFWLFGDTLWSAFGTDTQTKMDRAALEHYADVRAAQGFNFVNTILTSPGRNEGGPFFQDLKTQRINPAYYHEVDGRLAYLNGKGITVMLFLNWANPQDYIPVWQTFPSDEARVRFAKYAAARYSAYNVCFGVVGEWERKLKPGLLRQIGQAVAHADPHDRMVAVHCTLGSAIEPHWAVGELAAEPWISFGAFLQNYTNMHNQVLRSRVAKKPVVNGEYGYYLRDLNGDGVVDKRNGSTPRTMRDASYDIAMAGGYFVTGFGSTYWGGYRDPGHFNPDNLKHQPWIEDAQHLRALFTGLEWWKLAPHDEYVSGAGTAYCLASPASQYVVYVRRAGTPIVLSMPRQSGNARFDVQRFDPRTGGFDSLGEHLGRAPLTLKTTTLEDYVFVISGHLPKR